jgi:hypothetical protein
MNGYGTTNPGIIKRVVGAPIPKNYQPIRLDQIA